MVFLCTFDIVNFDKLKNGIMKRYFSILLILLCGWANAQTLNQAKQWFQNGDFERAKPVFKKLVKQSPGNAFYNFWYGACCYETDEKQTSETYLQKAADRKVINAYLYLAKLQTEQYRYEEATENLESYGELMAKKKNADTSEADRLMEYTRKAGRMLKGTEQVTVVDSFVVDKARFLNAYKIGKESGRIDFYNTFFQSEEEAGCTVFETELKNKIYFAKTVNDTVSLFAKDRLGDGWGEAYQLQGLDETGNKNFPFVLADGVTLYYAADGEESLGGYDIFVTRYNQETNRYLRPENLGMPFNSPANDYMYVIDEYNNLGWFASDRYQPEDKVCVYVFVPNESRLTYNYENTDEEVVRKAAMLRRIADTWSDESVVAEARDRLNGISEQPERTEPKHEFEFVIDDNATYYSLKEFRSTKARQLFERWRAGEKELHTLEKTLENKRDLYHKSQPAMRKALSAELLKSEKKLEAMLGQQAQLKKEIRNTEKIFISK